MIDKLDPTKIAGEYQHYKGKFYKVLGIVHHSETLEKFVLYQAKYDNPVGDFWVRPYEMFFSKVEINGKLFDRFIRV